MENTTIKISLVQGYFAEIVGKTTLLELLKLITTDKKLLANGQQLRKLHKTDLEAYDKLKLNQPGFILGDYSYRNADNCIEYSSVLGFDIDHVTLEKESKEIIEKLKAWDKAFLLLPSVSGLGIRLLVKTKSTLTEHKNYYASISSEISKITGIKLKSKLKDGFKLAGFSPEEVKKQLDSTPHIDDTTKDTCRFWYYTGVERSEVYMNPDASTFELKKAPVSKAKSNGQGHQYKYEFSQEDKVSYLAKKLAAANIDITAGVVDWFKVGSALANEFGESGRSLFHTVAKNHPDYDFRRNELEYNRCLAKDKGQISIGTFYRYCKDYGVEIDWQELKQDLSHLFPDAQRSQITNDQYGAPETATATIEEKPKIEIKTPANKEAERGIVAECIRKKYGYQEVLEYCQKFSHECFTDKSYRDVFLALERVVSDKLDVTRVSVASRLENINPKLGMDFINEIIQFQDYYETLNTNIDIVYGAFIRKKAVELFNNSSEELFTYDNDVFEILGEVSSEINRVADYGMAKTETSIQVAMIENRSLQKIRIENWKAGITFTGIPSGIRGLDDRHGGYQPGQLILRAARPGMGKTASLLVTILAAARAGFKVGFFTLEMTTQQLIDRLVSMEVEIPTPRLRSGQLSEADCERIEEKRIEIEKLPIWIDEKGQATTSYIARVSAKWKREHGVNFILADYLQIMAADSRYKGQKVNETGQISSDLKHLAKKLELPVLVLSQLNREVDKRTDKRPVLPDLRDSGTLEQDADIVEFIYRPFYYDILVDEDNNSLERYAEFILAKCRDGKIGIAKTSWYGEYTKFVDEDVPEWLNKTETVDAEYEEVKEPGDNVLVIGLESGDELPAYKDDQNMITRANKMNDDDIPF